MNKKIWLVLLGLCIVLSVVFKISYYSNVSNAKLKHSSDEKFLPIVAFSYQIDSYEKREYKDYDYDGDREYKNVTKYNITYRYEVDNTFYYITLNDKDEFKETLNIYYNPKNPEENSFFSTYEDALYGFEGVKIIGDIFVVVSISLLIINIYLFIYKKQETFDVKESKINYDDDYSKKKDKEELLNEYGILATDDFDCVVNVKQNDYNVIEEEDKEIVEKITTIPFKRKNINHKRDD